MKKLIIILLFIILAGKSAQAAPDSTQVTVTVTGHVTSSVTGMGIQGHRVYFLSDSSSALNISDSAYTDATGYYADTFMIPGSILYLLKVYTYDCQGFERDSLVGSPFYDFQVDFEICDTLPPACQAGFSYWTNPMNPAMIYFTDTSHGTIGQWNWDFGDGSSSNLQHPQHTYLSSGTYNVYLTISDSAGSQSCYSVISQTVNVTISPLFNLGGQVFGGMFPVSEGYAVLYKPGSPDYLSLDTAMLNSDGVYYFYQVPAGSYTVKAFFPESPTGGQGYFPTYSQTSLVWQSATTISLGQNLFDADVSLYPVPTGVSGNGAVSGEVFLGTATTPLPYANVEVLLFDSLMQPINYTMSGTDGSYAFVQLAEGMYYLMPEVAGKIIPAVSFHVGGSYPLVAEVDLTVPGSVIGISDDINDDFSANLYPNPVSTNCFLRLEMKRAMRLSVKIMDVSGRELAESRHLPVAGTNIIELPVSGLARGLYLVVIQGDDGGYFTSKLQLIHP